MPSLAPSPKIFALLLFGSYLGTGALYRHLNWDEVGSYNWIALATMIGTMFLAYWALACVIPLLVWVFLKPRGSITGPLTWGLVLGVMIFVYTMYVHREAVASAEEAGASKLKLADPLAISATVTSGPAEGFSESDLDAAAAKKYEEWLIATLIKKGKDYYTAIGKDPNAYTPTVSSRSSAIEIGGVHYVVVRVLLSGKHTDVQGLYFMGFKGQQFVRVNCVRPGSADIPASYGVCAEKILETFGVKLQPF